MRTWNDLTEIEQQRAVGHFEIINQDVPEGGQCDYRETAIEFGLDPKDESTRRALRKRREPAESDGIPKSTTPNYQDMILKVKGDAVVIGDLEVPDHDADILTKAVQVGEKFGIHQLIINGDAVAADGFSPFQGNLRRGIEPLDEVRILATVIRAMARQFVTVYLCEGNHDKRWRRMSDGQVTLSDEIADRLPDIDIAVTPFSQIHLTSGGRPWLVCHPKNYSKVPGSVPREIAEVQRKNVVAAHTHHLSECQTKCGEFMAVEGGYCRDEARTLYKADDITRHPKWNPGFVVIRNGYHYLFSADKTDWDYVLA